MRRTRITAAVVAALLVFPAAIAWGRMAPPSTYCQEIPVSSSAKDVHIGEHDVHLPARSKPVLCVTEDTDVTGTPTITFYKNCGDPCFAVRVQDVKAYQDLKVEIRWSEDGKPQSQTVDPTPANVTGDAVETCISNHSEGTADPCIITITTPQELVARGRDASIALHWAESVEAYGQTQVAGYEIWRSETGEPNTFELLDTSMDTSFRDRELSSGDTYYYFVVAFDGTENRSGGSEVATATAH
jgi:hypothetical protein